MALMRRQSLVKFDAPLCETIVDTPKPQGREVLVRIDAVAICATDLEIIHAGSPARIQGGLPFNKNFTPGHEYMGTIVRLGHSGQASISASAAAFAGPSRKLSRVRLSSCGNTKAS